MRKIIIILFSAFLFNIHLNAQSNNYFDPPATNTPTLFAPGTISDEFGNRDMALSPKGDELFYTLQYRSGFTFSTIMHSKKVNGKWTTPAVASFCGQYNDLEPSFSPDGTKLYFSSARPISGSEQKDYDIWYVTKENGSWVDPKNMGAPINSAKDEFYISVTKSGNAYFTREMQGKGEDIVLCKWNNAKYDTAVSLSTAINSNGAEFNAFVDADEKIIFFTGYKRKENIGTGDLYMSVKNKNGEWNNAVNMGKEINESGLTYCPYLSPDKKYFFFTSSKGIFKTPFDKKQNFEELRSLMKSALNGNDNIYWMRAEALLKIAEY